HGLVYFFRLAFDALENILRLFATAHEDDAFDGIVVVLVFVPETENTEARGVPDCDVSNVPDAYGRSVVAGHDDFADVFGGLYQADATHVVKLPALRVEAAAGVRVVGLQRVKHLHHGDVEVVEARRVKQHVVLHRRAAEARVVGDTGNAAISALDD